MYSIIDISDFDKVLELSKNMNCKIKTKRISLDDEEYLEIHSNSELLIYTINVLYPSKYYENWQSLIKSHLNKYNEEYKMEDLINNNIISNDVGINNYNLNEFSEESSLTEYKLGDTDSNYTINHDPDLCSDFGDENEGKEYYSNIKPTYYDKTCPWLEKCKSDILGEEGLSCSTPCPLRMQRDLLVRAGWEI